jgi:hypothetical protein
MNNPGHLPTQIQAAGGTENTPEAFRVEVSLGFLLKLMGDRAAAALAGALPRSFEWRFQLCLTSASVCAMVAPGR